MAGVWGGGVEDPLAARLCAHFMIRWRRSSHRPRHLPSAREVQQVVSPAAGACSPHRRASSNVGEGAGRRQLFAGGVMWPRRKRAADVVVEADQAGLDTNTFYLCCFHLFAHHRLSSNLMKHLAQLGDGEIPIMAGYAPSVPLLRC